MEGASRATAETVDRQMATGAIWMILAQVIDRGLGFVSIIVLARLLTPADFGLVAMATSIMAVLELAGTFGFDMALIQNPNAARADYDTAWTFHVIFGTVIAGALLAAASPAAWLYGEPRLEGVVAWLALATLVHGFENIGTVVFRKELRFDREFRLLVAKRLLSLAVTIPAAIALRTYWALIIGIVAGRGVGVLLTYLVQSYRPRLSLASRHALLGFSKWLVINNVLNFLGTRSADFLIGRNSGPRELGLFNLAYEISTHPTSALIAPMNRAFYPGYAIKATDRGTLRQSYLEVIGFIALVALPAGAGVASIPDLVVLMMLGPQWIDASPAVVLLSFYGVLLALASNNHYVYIAMGRPRIATLLGIVYTIMVLPAIALGSVRAGAYGAAVGYLAAQALFVPITWAILCNALDLRSAQVLRAVYRPLVAAAVMFGGVRAVAGCFDTGADHGGALFGLLLICMAAGAVLYAGAVYGLWSLASRPAGVESRALALLIPRVRSVLQRLRT